MFFFCIIKKTVYLQSTYYWYPKSSCNGIPFCESYFNVERVHFTVDIVSPKTRPTLQNPPKVDTNCAPKMAQYTYPYRISSLCCPSAGRSNANLLNDDPIYRRREFDERRRTIDGWFLALLLELVFGCQSTWATKHFFGMTSRGIQNGRILIYLWTLHFFQTNKIRELVIALYSIISSVKYTGVKKP